MRLTFPSKTLTDDMVWGEYGRGDVEGFLERIQSPRLDERYVDGPEPYGPSPDGTIGLAGLVGNACAAGDVNWKWILAKLQEETSFIRNVRPMGVGYRAPMGFDCPDGTLDRNVYPDGKAPRPRWRGTVRNIRAAIDWWRRARTFTAFPKTRRINVAPWGQSPAYDDVEMRTMAESAYLLYTPHLYGLRNVLNIYDEFFPSTAPSRKLPSQADVANIARHVAEQRRSWRRYVTVNGIRFDTHAGGWCGRFVRQCCEAALKGVMPGYRGYDAGYQDEAFAAFPWLRRYAAQACRALDGGGSGKYGVYERVSVPQPGDIVGMSPGYSLPGHIAVFLGQGLIAENTSSTSRGPGTVISSIADYGLQSRITGYYRVFPAGAVVERDLMLVGPNGEIECAIEETDGVATGDLEPIVRTLGLDLRLSMELGGYGKTLTEAITEVSARVKVRELLDGCGLIVRYMVREDGRRRIYARWPTEMDLRGDNDEETA